MPIARPRAIRLLSFATACMLWSAANVSIAQNAVGETPTARQPASPQWPAPGGFRRSSSRRVSPGAITGLEIASSDANTEKEDRFLIERIDPERTLDVVQGRPTVLRFRLPPFRDQVGDPDVAELSSISESEISVTGNQVGSTTVNFWFKDQQTGQQEVLSYLVRVTDDPEQSRQFERLLENLERDINRGFPNSTVDLSYVGAQVVVRGKARDIEEATNILRIVSQSLPDDGQAEEAALRNTIDPNIAPVGFQPNTTAESISGFTIDEIVNAGGLDNIFQGNTVTGANAININNRIVNMLEIAGIHQVMLKVTLAEVVRDSGRSLISSAQFGVDRDDPLSSQLFQGNGVFYNQGLGIGELTFQSDQFFLQLDALKRLGLARSLSEPNLTTLSGQPATFLVGGQFPVTTVSANQVAITENVDFIPFGVQLAVLPTVTDGDRIRLQLMAMVSETAGVNGGGDGGATGGDTTGQGADAATGVPSLSTRRFNSTVELRDGESLALAGLIRNSVSAESRKVPFLGDLPVVGSLLFGDRSLSYSEQELLVVVTPHLISPVPSGVSLPMPGSDTFEPDDLEFFIHGSIEGTIAEDYRTPVRGNIHRMEAFRRCEQKYIIGMPGHSSGRPLPELNLPSHPTPDIMTGEVLR